ncbi:DUF805 domain-containing protein [Acinetobacter cumulans]|jgi:uncharacterized membrane protein YhaH (DUF805 family)|uniref:DUF805 domain-containing protein n=1 Tax=Acinetobacter cumulans TaxID=2136182 RepID=A0A498D0F4_9GAMM|nr:MULTISPECIES: DUF805 domain-containing protein [Acinetobacter]NWK73314.1 DUF805 domain-containing protein [Acinetobacter sp. SwsAc6]QCO20917.1 DUF805 domain-containing protein [Acinetobacter cumulans]RLL37036.1 DUF805 domain-containing protein [Acinetobacter cumulans]RLL49564.1 DUF805 domain-containing protein [Acinetobacter cumulans]
MNPQESSPFFSRNPPPTPDNPLSFNGRFGRLSFIGWYTFFHIVMFFVGFGLTLFTGVINLTSLNVDSQLLQTFASATGLSYTLLLLVYLYFSMVLISRRLHDLNKSGWWMLLFFIPVLNVLFILYLLFAAGNTHPNQYGWPRPSAVWEKILAWLMIILTVLSILATGSLVSFMMGSGQIETPQEVIQKGTAYF